MPMNFKGIPTRFGTGGQFWQLVDPVNDRYGWATGGGGGGNVATDPIWQAKGDLAAGTGISTAVREPVGTDGQVLTADSTQTTGLRWSTPVVYQGLNANLTSISGLSPTGPTQVQTWTGVSTASLTDYTTDWLAQYALIAGRTGNQTWTMSTTTIGTLIGSSVGTTSAALNLRADATNAPGSHLGNIYTEAPIHMQETNVAGSANETLTADPGPTIQARGNKTLNYASASYGSGFGIYAWRGTLLFNQSPTGSSIAFKAGGTYSNVSGTPIASLGSNAGFNSSPTYQADGAAVTFNATADVFSGLTFKTINAGTLTAATDWVNFEAQVVINDSGCSMTGSYAAFSTFAPTITAGSMSVWSGFRVLAGTYNTLQNIGVEIRTMTGGTVAGSSNAINIAGLVAGAGTTSQTCIFVGAASGAASGNNIGIDVAAPSGAAGLNIGIRSAGSVLHTGTGGIGYTVGAGGSVTQTTSRTTGVTINNITGQITLVSAAGTAGYLTFIVTNSTVGANDTIDVTQKTGSNIYGAVVNAISAGSFSLSIAALAGTTTEAPAFQFNVHKGSIT